MRIFFDTNVILEYLLNRQNANDVERVLTYTERIGALKFVSSGSFYTLTYLLDIDLKRKGLEVTSRVDRLRKVLNILLSEYSVVDCIDWNEGVNDSRFLDMEDSYQFQAALAAHCNFLLTFNLHDFGNVLSEEKLCVLSPKEFLLRIKDCEK